MKWFRKIILGSIFLILTSLILLYTYAFVDRLPLDEQRKNITIYDNNGNVMYESNFKKNMQWTSIEDIPQFVQDAFVSVEDKRFYYHAGFDPIRITKAISTNLLHGDILQGGSTITQQYAKNLFLTNEQTVTRKIHEFFYAARLEMQYNKKEILEGYLNTAYFGHGIYGIRSASRYFFDKDMKDLSIGETAMLVGIPNGPSIYSPYLHKENAIKRQHLILNLLQENGMITTDEKRKAIEEPLTLSQVHTQQQSGMDEYYIDAVIAELNELSIDLDQEIHVHTNYDPDVQQALDTAIRTQMKMDDELETAAIIVQPFTGNVLAMAGGKDYTISQFNRTTQASRQVASTIKPLLYYCALQQGFTPATQFVSQKTTFRLENNETYAPSNYDDQYANGKISLINAISLSDNIYAVKTHLFLGEDTLHQALLDFDISQSSPNPSEALGTVNMNLLELSRIYTTFASEGLYSKPALISSITSDDKILYERKVEPKRVMQRDETLILSQLLTSTFDIRNKGYAFPSMYGYQPKVKMAAKSGTSDWDSLVMAYNPEYVIGVWCGFDDNRKLNKQYYPNSKKIFQDTVNALYKKPTDIWYQPSDQIEEIRVNPITGEPTSDGSVYWFQKGSR